MVSKRKQVLFLCTHNSARSQIAEGLLNALYGNEYQAFSAGIKPTHVNPYAIEVMKEIGIDLSTHSSKSITDLIYVFGYCLPLFYSTRREI